MDRTYIAIDLKSFYASVECMERGLDPLTTNLVVADEKRTEKTICLAATPAIKSFGVSGRARLFEVNQRIREANAARIYKAPGRRFSGSSCDRELLKKRADLSIDFIIAPPRMALYIEYSARIYEVYLKYIASEDMHVYSIDEVFIDATSYLKLYGQNAHDLSRTIIRDVLKTTGITATAGIGNNLYLSKVAMDIVAKKMPPDADGVRVAELDEMGYRRLLWDHKPITDFWRVGKGYARKLEKFGIQTMGDIARISIKCEDLLYRLFGVNAELLIDHAWGWEPCSMAEIRAYRPASSSICLGQVLHSPYTYEKARLAVREMADSMAMDLMTKGLVCGKYVLTVGYDVENLATPEKRRAWQGKTVIDAYGKELPKPAHGTTNLASPTALTKPIMDAVTELFECITDERLLVRRVSLTAATVIDKDSQPKEPPKQLSLLALTEKPKMKNDVSMVNEEQAAQEKREENRQKAILTIRQRYGKNAILRGMNLEEGATTPTRHSLIGGHKA